MINLVKLLDDITASKVPTADDILDIKLSIVEVKSSIEIIENIHYDDDCYHIKHELEPVLKMLKNMVKLF
jgi:hypothetical protein